MKILHINDYYIYSGAEKVYRDIYTKLKGEKITLNDYLFKNNYLKLFNKLFISFRLFYKIKKVLKLYKPDIIIIHQINLSPFSVLLAIKGHKNIVQIVHDATQAGCPSGWCIFRDNFKKCNIKMGLLKCKRHCAYDKIKIVFFVYYFWLKFFLYLKKKIVRKYISPSYELKNILLDNNFKNISVLGNSIYFNNNKINKKENIFIYVGAIDKRKGIDKLLEAIDELDFIKKEWKFIIIGGGEILNELKNKYSDYFYNFLGKIDNKIVIDYLKKSKIVFFPSLGFESFGMTALEGILYDNIVLGNNFGGVKEIIGFNFLFNILNKNNIKEKIVDVLNNYNEYFLKSQLQKKLYIRYNKEYYNNLIKIINK